MDFHCLFVARDLLVAMTRITVPVFAVRYKGRFFSLTDDRGELVSVSFADLTRLCLELP